MTAEEAIIWIESARYSAMKVGLENMRALLEILGNPERGLKCVHVAGTNGKGSVCALMESALRNAGYKTGLYTSPYLMRYNERMRIANVPIDDETLVGCAERVKDGAARLYARGIRPSAFELGTAVAFCAFREAKVDMAVIETGLGGRLDPTNVIRPEVCAIASIGMDHMNVLGDTVELIAGEKAGIIKPDTPCAVYPAEDSVINVIESAARRAGAKLYLASDYDFIGLRASASGSSFSIDLPVFGLTNARLHLPGKHQEENARLAMLTMSILAQKGFDITRQNVENGIDKALWPGRLEWFGDNILLDGAHNVDGARALSEYITSFLAGREIVLLTGMMSDKMPKEYASIIAPLVSRVISTQVDWHRAVGAEEMAGIYSALGVESESVQGIENAFARAKAVTKGKEVLLVAGSLYLVGAVRKLLCP